MLSLTSSFLKQHHRSPYGGLDFWLHACFYNFLIVDYLLPPAQQLRVLLKEHHSVSFQFYSNMNNQWWPLRRCFHSYWNWWEKSPQLLIFLGANSCWNSLSKAPSSRLDAAHTAVAGHRLKLLFQSLSRTDASSGVQMVSKETVQSNPTCSCFCF